MKKTALLFAFLLVASSAHAQDPRIPQSPGGSRGTAEDQRACGPDARRLCRGVIQDDFAVLRCFQQNRRKLSRACLAVLQKYGQ